MTFKYNENLDYAAGDHYTLVYPGTISYQDLWQFENYKDQCAGDDVVTGVEHSTVLNRICGLRSVMECR